MRVFIVVLWLFDYVVIVSVAFYMFIVSRYSLKTFLAYAYSFLIDFIYEATTTNDHDHVFVAVASKPTSRIKVPSQ